ncbi:MAG: dephospho-CoA kinase [Bacteroidales bacterium]|nr:dephospho-CoA kinase [Bacteroidales bacterium]
MIRIGITGGIGSGKSFVARKLEALGVPVYDTDSRARSLITASPQIRQGLSRLVGPGAYLPDGQLDRPRLAVFLFSDPAHAAAVNAIVHPAVRADFREWCEGQTAPVVALESAILYEARFETEVDRVLMVYAPLDLRLRRAMERDGVPEAKVRARIAAQMDDEEKCRRADFVVVNDGSAPLDTVLQELLASLPRSSAKNHP